MPIKILGAGISGLTAAINLAKAGRNVTVFEKRPTVGRRFRPNLQGLFTPKNIHNYFEEINLQVNFYFKKIRYCRFKWIFMADTILDWYPIEVFFIQRGGSKGSVEQGLMSQAKRVGVKFQFNTDLLEEEADIIATGPRLVHGAAYGAIFNCSPIMRNDEMVIMFNNEINTKDSYMFAIPYNGHIEIFMVCPLQKLSQIKKNHKEGLKYFDSYYHGEAASTIIGHGNFLNPKTAIIDGRLYTGEAAGFQDPFMGFGNHFSIRSGYLAAKSIIEGTDYDKLWKKEFKTEFERGLTLRFFSSLFGDKFVYRLIKTIKKRLEKSQTKKGEENNFYISRHVQSFIWLISKLEILKKRITGYW